MRRTRRGSTARLGRRGVGRISAGAVADPEVDTLLGIKLSGVAMDTGVVTTTGLIFAVWAEATLIRGGTDGGIARYTRLAIRNEHASTGSSV